MEVNLVVAYFARIENELRSATKPDADLFEGDDKIALLAAQARGETVKVRLVLAGHYKEINDAIAKVVQKGSVCRI